MNTNITARRILCYGDSNTWGSIPGKSKRFPANVRWTGVLQILLGNEYEIIEEGLSARTTNIDDTEHMDELRNGRKYLIPCLNSHIPLDYVILFLGANDLKGRYNRKPEEVAADIEDMINLISDMKYIHETVPPKILLVFPPIVDNNEEGIKGKYDGGEAKSKQLGVLLTTLSQKYNLPFVDLSKEFPPMGHLNAEAHKKLAQMLVGKLQVQ